MDDREEERREEDYRWWLDHRKDAPAKPSVPRRRCLKCGEPISRREGARGEIEYEENGKVHDCPVRAYYRNGRARYGRSR